MSQSSINPTIILNELRSGEIKLLFEHLKNFTDYLEEKNDPDPVEIEIVDASYQLIEKIQLFESVMKKYTMDAANEMLGNKLTELYSSGRVNGGTSTLFR